MYRHSTTGKGQGIYKACSILTQLCVIADCGKPADWTVVPHDHMGEEYHCCEAHLLSKDFVLNGKCDSCRKFSLEKWLCTARDAANQNVVSLCKTCKRKFKDTLEK